MSPALLIAASLAITPQAELIDFTAKWCEPCQQMKPIVEKLHREGLPVRQVDFDENRALANRYRVTGLPTFVLVVNDKEVARLVGRRSEDELRQMLKLLPNESVAAPASAPASTPPKRNWIPAFLDRNSTPEATIPPSDPIARGQSPDEAPPGPTSADQSAPVAAKNPMQTAVRISVKDAEGVDYGSGTVIGSKEGQALILTCFHIFRGHSPSDSVEVDLFPHGPDREPVTYRGEYIKGDEDADVALVGITGSPLMPVSPIAPPQQFPKQGDLVFSVGCAEGRPQPTKLQHHVTRINPFDGADTTECTGEPAVGRSGGGLFKSEGRVIGVCFAAQKNPQKPRGVYAGPKEIHTILSEAGFAALIPQSRGEALAETGTSIRNESPQEQPQDPANVFADQEEEIPQTASAQGLGAGPNDPASGSPAEFAEGFTPETREVISPLASGHAASVLADLAEGELEATVVLRRRDRPDMASQVVVINRVSDRFRRYLTGDVAGQPIETSLHQREPRTARVARLAAIFNNHAGPTTR